MIDLFNKFKLFLTKFLLFQSVGSWESGSDLVLNDSLLGEFVVERFVVERFV